MILFIGSLLPNTEGGRLQRDVCQTISGPGANKPCIFPFRYNGVTYNTCTLVSSDENKPWCSTLVDENNNHVPGGGHYGDCGPKCPLPGKFIIK